MHAIDMASPDLGWGDSGGGVQGYGGLDFSDLDPTGDELADVLDAIGETDAEALVDSLTDDDLAGLEAYQVNGSPPGMGPGTEFASWMDSLPDDQFHALRGEAAAYSEGDPLGYMSFARDVDRLHDEMNGRERIRREQDAAELARRRGPHGQRPGDEIMLSNALARYERGTYLYGQQPADLASDWPGGDPFAGDQFSTGPAAGPGDAISEMFYQLTGQGLPPARQRPQPLPPVSALAKQIGLVP